MDDVGVNNNIIGEGILVWLSMVPPRAQHSGTFSSFTVDFQLRADGLCSLTHNPQARWIPRNMH